MAIDDQMVFGAGTGTVGGRGRRRGKRSSSPDDDTAALGFGSHRGGNDVVEASGDVLRVVAADFSKVIEVRAYRFALGQEVVDLTRLDLQVAAVEPGKEARPPLPS
ncbi:hypothetical protein ACIPUC_14465 [Streptomyces sp. LARHCF249]